MLLSAPPGAGKTTRVPIVLLREFVPRGSRIIMLEPRRMAARRAAEYLAGQLNEKPGMSVGYRIRGDTRVSPATRIEVVTEGVLTRLLQEDPFLPGVACVIFDEFHERSIHADLGLALALDAQAGRDDLRILVMSATLDGLRLGSLLPSAPLVECGGTSFPVATHYVGPRTDGPIEPRMIDPIRRALAETGGDLLVFLPGQREIRRTAEILGERRLPPEVRILQLFSDAPAREQSAALSPAPPGMRKVILSTSVAETSLTIDGVTAVVDSGLARVPRFDPRRGMAGLVTIPISRAGADQRRGRAGRTRPGSCYRLWSETQHRDLPPYAQPEILAADLAPLALELARWGDPRALSLRFIDPPPDAHLRQAQGLLTVLGALDSECRITPHGREMARYPVHPRLAHMIIRGAALRLGGMACDLAALLEEREILSGERREINLLARWEALRTGRGASEETRERILREGARLRALLHPPPGDEDAARCGLLLALAYPERIARRRERDDSRYQLANGSGGTIPRDHPLGKSPFLAVGEADGAGTEVRIFSAAPVSQAEIESEFADRIVESDEIRWSEEKESVVARRVRMLDALILTEGKSRPEGPRAVAALIDGIRRMGLDSLPWGKGATAFRMRSEWVRNGGLADASWPDLSDPALSRTLEKWLAPDLEGRWQRAHLLELDLLPPLRALFTPRLLRELDRLAPAALTLPSGSKIPLLYESGEAPVLAVRLQELFGQTDTPTVGGGRIPVVVHLLSPARRPLAVTRDLRSFWTTTYPSIRTQMRARYPRHLWPENPLTATPTHRTARPGG